METDIRWVETTDQSFCRVYVYADVSETIHARELGYVIDDVYFVASHVWNDQLSHLVALKK